ncbi:MAG: trimethylamine methyltransferase family protein [Candidatus Latescibacteria bacterium]|nr:trimethylamine methyltransferase family protein [Candidatus Latescibacterota bacterium]
MPGLSANQIEHLQQATEDLLATTGFRVQHPELLRLAAAAGARVEETSGRVKIPAPLLRQLLAQAPTQYEIAGAGSRRYLVGGGGQHCLAIVTDPWILDYHSRQPRHPVLSDIGRHTRIAQQLEPVAAISLMDYPVADHPGPASFLRALEEHLLHHDKHCYVLAASAESLDRWLRLVPLLTAGRTAAESRLITVGVAILSPLTLTQLNGDLLLQATRHDLPVVPTVCPMAGTTAPYSKAGTLLLAHAEVVFLAALTQLVRPGHPFLYMMGPSRTDLRKGGDLYYTLDKVLWKLASVQLGKNLGLPTGAECGGTMRCTYDLQSGAEGMLFMQAALQSGAEMLSGIGSCGNAVAMSGEMMVVQQAWLEAARFLETGMDTGARLGLDSIAARGPGVHYLEDDLTLELMRGEEFFGHELFGYGEEEGAPLLERAHQRAEALAADRPSPLPGNTQEALRRFFTDERAGLER